MFRKQYSSLRNDIRKRREVSYSITKTTGTKLL